MAAHARTAVIYACLLAAVSGCALSPKKTDYTPPPLTQEQSDWWEANKHRRQYIDGKGWYIPGTSGFFDDSGRRVSSDFIGDRKYEESSGGLLESLSPKTTWKKSMIAIGRGPNEQVARKALADGDDLFRQKKFEEAAKKYKEAYKRWPDSPLEEEAIFKCGEAEFFADHYAKAEDQYALLLKKFNSTQYLNLVVNRRFAIGRYWEQYDQEHPHWAITPNFTDKTRPMFDTGGHAIRVYQRNRIDDPTGPLADDSVMATANAYFIRGSWDDADYHYGLIRTEYPRSDFQYQAHLLGLHCKLVLYQGPGYDTSPLDEADKLAVQLLTQFPKELGKDREEVVRIRGEVRHEQAKNLWEKAEFYAGGEHYAAARIYYDKILKEYPNTDLAQQSRTKLDQFVGLPDHPTPVYQWLVELLPESKASGPIMPKNVLTAGAGSSVRKQSPR